MSKNRRMVYIVNVQLVLDPTDYPGYDPLSFAGDVCLGLLTEHMQAYQTKSELVDWRFPDTEVQLVYVHPKATYTEDEAFDVLDARYQDREE